MLTTTWRAATAALAAAWRTLVGLEWTVRASVPGRFTIWLAVAYSLGQGAGILWGGPGRWTGPAYTVVRELPGSPWSWGATLVTFGLVLAAASLTKRFWWKAAALLGISVWSSMFAVGAMRAAALIPTVGTTGGPAYLFITGATAILIVVREERRDLTPPTGT